jgi:EAL domain-containing protein (putative c-di-GMP-specific phosphodiesterase class I)
MLDLGMLWRGWEGATITVPADDFRPARGPLSRHVSELLESPDLLRPVFQPILSLATGTVVGYEGLSRFAIERRESPDRWFAEATRAGMGADLQAVAIGRILGVAAQSGLPAETFLSLNVSPRYLSHAAIAAAIAGADPSTLVLELTEEEAVRDYRALRRAMGPYLRRGVRFAVDDAGAGFASMRHVTELQPAFVKLDADLIRGMRSRQTLRAFLRAINGFTMEIGATLVAEGVEAASDLAVLTETGFPLLAQGFAIARPSAPWPDVNAAATRAWHDASQNRPAPSPRRRVPSRGMGRSPRIPIESGVNIGPLLGPSLRRAGIESLETLRTVGALAAWRRLRASEPEIANERVLLALEGAIRGVRWAAVPGVERRRLITAVSAE